MKIVSAILTVMVTIPIWFYLLYKILQAVNASELTWFLFWIYVPVIILVSLLKFIIDDQGKKP